MAIKLHSSFAVHPGAWLRAEVIEARGLSLSEAAEKVGVPRQAMSDLLDGAAALSEEMASQFEKALGLSADTLMRMQEAHDLNAGRAGR